MPKKIFRIVIGTVFCFIALFVISRHPVNAFDLFGLLKSKTQEPYQAQGSFQPDAYISRAKEAPNKSAMSKRGSLLRIDCVPVTANKISIKVSNEGEITGSGEIGPIACTWYKTDEEWGVYKAVYMDWRHEFIFSGKAMGNDLKGQVKQIVYSWQEKSSENELAWSAKKEGNTITGTVVVEGGNLPFTATASEVTEVETTSTPEVSLEPTPSPSPSPQPGEKKKLKLLDLEGKPITKGKARIRLKDGTIKEVDITNGEVIYDSGLTKMITVEDLDNHDRKLTLQGNDLEREKVIMATEEEWLNQMMPKLERLAQILNEGQEVDINQYFEINPNADSNEHKPPLFDFLRRFGFKDKINFNAEQMAWTSDVNTVIHEILGHAFTEVVGEGNKMTYGGVGSHDDPWQPAFTERSFFNPARWLGGKIAALSEDKAKGMALSEGWAQYVGDKWDRELKNIPDEESELTTANAQSKMVDSKNGAYGKLYEEEGYGAKVENVVATVFNEVYKGKSLEEAVADFAAVRKEFKRINNGKSFQTVNQFIYQKIEMIEDGTERERVEKLMEDLVLK